MIRLCPSPRFPQAKSADRQPCDFDNKAGQVEIIIERDKDEDCAKPVPRTIAPALRVNLFQCESRKRYEDQAHTDQADNVGYCYSL